MTLTAGTGGSLLAIGSAAGVALLGTARGFYTFGGHLKWTPVIALGYLLSHPHPSVAERAGDLRRFPSFDNPANTFKVPMGMKKGRSALSGTASAPCLRRGRDSSQSLAIHLPPVGNTNDQHDELAVLHFV